MALGVFFQILLLVMTLKVLITCSFSYMCLTNVLSRKYVYNNFGQQSYSCI